MLVEPRGAPTRPRLGREWSDEFDDAVRGLASGFLIGIPVVFTVDSWWLGDQNEPLDSLMLLAASYVLTLAAIYWIGFRRGLRRGWQYLGDAVEALALAMLALVAVFWVLGQIGDGQAPSIAVGRIAVAIAPVSLGVAVANHLLARDSSRVDPDRGDASAMRAGLHDAPPRRALLELAASAAGALFLLVILLSLLVTYSVVFAAGFAGEADRHRTPGPLQTPFAETVTAYVAALLVCLVVLWLFGRIDQESAAVEVYAKTVLLAFPASMAAAAGRLAV
jgi:putative integral membrane protein (TIGR02587 family)